MTAVHVFFFWKKRTDTKTCSVDVVHLTSIMVCVFFNYVTENPLDHYTLNRNSWNVIAPFLRVFDPTYGADADCK